MLIYGKDRLLLETRAAIFLRAGYVVNVASELADAQRAIIDDKPSLAVLCHSLDEADCRSLLIFVEARSPETRCIVLTSGITGCETGNAEYFEALRGPALLLQTIEGSEAHV